MKIATILFTYNRSIHTSKVLEGLKKNTVLPQMLYIFQDGLKIEEHRTEWEKVNTLIKEVDFCPVEVHVSTENRGLAKSIVNGINCAFENYDAVIVLEDDCVPSENFMTFMVQALEKYEASERVFSLSGYAWPIGLESNTKDAYFCGRISSWGWGTWKDRWEKLELNYNIIRELKNDSYSSKQLGIWGNDSEDMLVGNIKGNTDSWAVFWALSVIKQGGLCLNPYYSLINNIGFDGSGVHCSDVQIDKALDIDVSKKCFDFPDQLVVQEEVKEAFAPLFRGVYHNNTMQEKPATIVYGLGNFYKRYERDINKENNIIAYIDKYKKGYYAGVKIEKLNVVCHKKFDFIIVMILDLRETIKIIHELHDLYNVPYEKIKLGQELFDKQSSLIQGISENGRIVIEVNGHSCEVASYDEYENAKEVFKDNIYCYHIHNNKGDVVFDVGGSIGDSTLYFLETQNVEKVYMYEPFQDTFIRAKENLKNYLESERLEVNQYGISNKTECREIMYNVNMSCAQSTISSVRENAKILYSNWKLIDENDEKSEMIEVRCATDIFAPLVKKHEDKNLILKMDCEGEEYNIISDLVESGVLQKFHFIMLEWHYQGKESLLADLDKAGFSYWCCDKTSDMGLIYAYK